MRPVAHRRFRFQVLLGALLTTIVVAADAGGLLDFLENKLYDLRCRHCQAFLRPPVPPVHVDIDEAALQAIGRWPWPRSKVALVVDELYAAGAKVVALDILFQDATPAEDEVLARSLGGGGGSVLPVLFGSPGGELAAAPSWQRLHVELLKDLELSVDDAKRATGSTPAAPAGAGAADLFEREFLTAREEAMFRRASAELDAGQTDRRAVRARLLPGLDPDVTGDELPLARVFDDQFDLAMRVRAMRPFFRDRPAGAPAASRRSNQTPPSLPLARASAGCGFVDYVPDADGTVRAVPLWLEVDGRLLPQLGLAAARQALGARPQDLRVTADAVVIPRPPPARDIVIPVHTHDFGNEGEPVPYCIDVPMYGGRAWERMYDVPGRPNKLIHLSALAAYRVAKTRETIRRNEGLADAAVGDALGVIDPEAAADYASLAPGVRPRGAMIARAVAEIPEKLEELAAVTNPDAELSRAIRTLTRARDALARYPAVDAPLREQLARQHGVLAEHVTGRTVFLGWAAAGLDTVSTPLHQECPGVVVHGAVYNAAMSGELWRSAPHGYTLAITTVFGLLATLLVAWMSPARALAGVLGFAAAYAGVNGVLLFDYWDLIVGLAGPLMVAGVVWSGLTLSLVINEIRERSRITRRFQSYVDPNLVKYVIEHPELSRLEGEVREMTVVFTDLAGFTSMTERLKERAVEILGRYMTHMVPVIRRHNGLVHKFMGDGIMFSFGAPLANPHHAADAVAAVLAMQAELERFNGELKAEGYEPLTMRTGVSTGMVVVGDSGAADASDYTCLGDTTNLGARLESANKAVGTRDLLSERTVELFERQFLVSPVGRLVVAGKSEGVMTYTPIAPAADATDAQRRAVELARAMVDAFLAARFTECVAAADALDAACGPSKLTSLYRDLSTRYTTDPPGPGFHGQIVLREK